MKNKRNYGVLITNVIFILVTIISCVPVQKLKYLNDIDELQGPRVNPREQKLISPFDRIYVQVFSIDEKTNQLFNTNNIISIPSASSVIGYLVDESGNINYPFIGKINLSGLTTEQAGLKLEKALNEYVSNAEIIIKFIDNSITLLGEVQNQGSYSFNRDKINIYEALALGGGITQYGDRRNIILVRQESNKVIHHKLNLTNSGIAGKDNYYVQANDVIIVEPLKSSSWYRFNSNTYSTILTTFTTLLAIFVVFFQR